MSNSIFKGIQAKKLYWFSQLYGWSFYLMLVIFWNLLTGTLNFTLINVLLVSFGVGMLYSHVYRNFMVRAGWLSLSSRRIILNGILGSTVLGTLISLTIAIISDLFLTGIDRILVPPFAIYIQQFMSWTITMQVWTLLYFGYHFFDNYKREEIKNLELQTKSNEIELLNLRSQLNPHFMFNALNSIRAMVDENPDTARKAITQLSLLLRYSLVSGKYKTQALLEEIKLIENYLALEQLRFEDRLRFSLDVPTELHAVQVPPLMIQTLVENAVKHGIAKRKNGGFIELKAYTRGEFTIIEIKNSGTLNLQKNQYENETGIGLENTKKRLRLLFGENAALEVKQLESEVVQALVQLKNIEVNTSQNVIPN
ncbi:MAG: sensor histidine kinase [Luteibaculaceae bacterium]